jgi:protein-S-isoprenylcysteine O-methyltransferase Ste14
MIKFDPFGWFGHIVPSAWLYRIINACLFTVVLGFLVVRIGQYRSFFFKPLWATETILFDVLAFAFIIRSNPVARSQGIREIIVPLTGSILPFGLLLSHPSPWIAGNRDLLTAVVIWMTLSTGFTVWGMWTLRHSFSITVEARELVSTGPYRWVRHPIYTGEILSAFSVAFLRFSWFNIFILAVFVIIQLSRSYWEESKLKKVFPDYRNSTGRSPWFWSSE